MSKSSLVRVRTNFPSLSVTIASTSTLSVSARKIGGAVCGGGGPRGGRALTAAGKRGAPGRTGFGKGLEGGGFKRPGGGRGPAALATPFPLKQLGPFPLA